MLPSGIALATAAVIIAIVAAAVYLLKRRRQRQPPERCLLPPPITVKSEPENPLTAWDRRWQLPVPDNGAVVFRLDRAPLPQGTALVVGLQSAPVTAHTWMQSGAGYALTIANQQHRTQFAHLPMVSREMMGSRIAHNYRLRSGETYWVAVQHGLLAFGEGDTPGERTVLCTRDPAGQPLHVRYVGFGLWAAHQPNTEPVSAQLSHVCFLPLAAHTLRHESAITFEGYFPRGR